MHFGANAVYRLVHLQPLSKSDVQAMVRKADNAFWTAIVENFPWTASGDLSPLATLALSRAQEEAVTEWIRNNVNPQHRDDAAA